MKTLFAFLIAAALGLAPASADLLLLGVGVNVSSALSPFSLAFVTSAIDATGGAATFTENTQNVGTDATGSDHRWTIVGWSAASATTRTISSSTICGVAATAINVSATNLGPSGLYIADTTGKGTSCTLAITFSGNESSIGWGIYRMINPGSSTPDATNIGTWAGVSTAITLSQNINAGGSAVAVASCKSAVDRTFTWVGLTKDYDTVMLTGSGSNTGAHGGSAGTPTTITVTPSGVCNGTAESASWH